MLKPERPIVMTIAGHDPSGGAGIQADMEAISYTDCHPVSVISCLTVQDTRNVQRIQIVDPDFMLQQARTLLADMSIDVIKLGLLGSIETIEAVSQLLAEFPKIPVVFDPVLAAGGGTKLSTEQLISSIKEQLLPKITLLTPNIPEAIQLGIAEQNADNGAIFLSGQGCENILITGTHSDTEKVHNSLYCKGELVNQSSWKRLEHEYHGSGCTLASNIAGWLAHGFSLQYAVGKGQEFTWNSLKKAQRLGQGQLIPYRI